MKVLTRLASTAGIAVALVGALAGPALADSRSGPDAGHSRDRDHAVFVQTDNPSGNQIVAYERAHDGTLTLENTYATGGNGGVLNGSVVDHLASQGSLVYDSHHDLLFAVNAGSNTVSVFSVEGDDLALRQVIDSGGTFPVSVATDGEFVYVLNALDGGNVAGFRITGNRLRALDGSVRPLGLVIPTDTTQFTHTPGQVAFSPDGSQLIVTTKANGDRIDVFAVSRDGRLSNDPVVNSNAGTVPFAVSFDSARRLVVAEAGTNALATFALHRDGTVSLINRVATGQSATCWVESASGFFFASNAGSASLSGFRIAGNGNLNLLGATSTDPGTVDAAASPNGQFLYVQAGKDGNVDEFRVNADGTLTAIGSVTVAGAAGGEGIVAI
jgi:6-phosphogluconolactonase (cycloisomerase 2 family)